MPILKPFKCKRMFLYINVGGADIAIGVVEGLNIELIREGGIEFYYSSETGKHAKGTRHATFTIRRWLGVDVDKDLLYDLFNDETPFSLIGKVDDQANLTIFLSDCEIYRWRPVTGATNDIIAEEAVGEAVDWRSGTVITD